MSNRSWFHKQAYDHSLDLSERFLVPVLLALKDAQERAREALAIITDANAPLDAREAKVRELWESTLTPCVGRPTRELIFRAIVGPGYSDGLLSWLGTESGAGRLEEFLPAVDPVG
jgi:hypothetical protein